MEPPAADRGGAGGAVSGAWRYVPGLARIALVLPVYAMLALPPAVVLSPAFAAWVRALLP